MASWGKMQMALEEAGVYTESRGVLTFPATPEAEGGLHLKLPEALTCLPVPF